MRPVTRPAYTVMASASMRWVEANGDFVRALTPREAATLQTFPEDYFIGDGSLASQRRGVGNAVPVEAARRWMLAVLFVCSRSVDDVVDVDDKKCHSQNVRSEIVHFCTFYFFVGDDVDDDEDDVEDENYHAQNVQS